MMRAAWGFFRLVVVFSSWMAGSVLAQEVGIVQSDILVLDPDRLYIETLMGQRIAADLQAERDQLIAHNRKVEAELGAEEKALTELRATKNAVEFRALADEFDAKVQEMRRASERAVRDHERNRERAPILFMRAIEPVLADLLEDANGAVIMDQRSVLLRSDVIDVTDVAISRVDAAIGSGEGLSVTGDE
jgi:Skp family chaperone for outer membrane proteins